MALPLEFSPLEMAIATRYADKVSVLMKTTHREAPQDVRFLLAFEDAVGDNFGGDVRYRLSQAVGSILGKRPKSRPQKDRDSVFPATTLPSMTFVVEKADQSEVILATTVMGEKLTYRRNKDGLVVNTSATNHVRQFAEIGKKRAEELFAQMDRDAVTSGSITLCERTSDLLTMTIGDKWKMIACRGARDVIAQVSEISSGVPTPQNKIPVTLLKEARGIAKWYLWRDTKTLSLIC